MSDKIIRKLSSKWLDNRDTRSGDIGAGAAEFSNVEEHIDQRKVKWETILGQTSREASLERNLAADQGRAAVDAGSSQSKCAVGKRDGAQLAGQKRSFAARMFCTGGPPNRTTFADIGRARFIRSKTLFSLRAIGACVLGIAAGMSFALRETAAGGKLVYEQFIWLHIASLFLFPFLLLASLKVMYLILDEYQEEEMPSSRLPWILTSVVSHILGSLSHTELLRVIVLCAVPSLQPAYISVTSDLYNLRSIFAAQRYLLSLTSLTELIFSCTPHRFYYIVVVFIVSTCWELAMFHSRPLDKTMEERIAFSCGSVAIAVKISAITVMAHRALTICAAKESETAQFEEALSNPC